MSGTVNGLPYPTGTDKLRDGDNAIQALAEAIGPRLSAGWSGEFNVSTNSDANVTGTFPNMGGATYVWAQPTNAGRPPGGGLQMNLISSTPTQASFVVLDHLGQPVRSTPIQFYLYVRPRTFP